MSLTLSATAQPLPVPEPSENDLIEVGPLRISSSDQIARAWGQALMLSVKELNLLTELAKHADRVIGREELFRLAWKREMRPGDRSVDVYVRRLRVKLERAMPGWCFIHTHFGFGYRLSPERSQLSDDRFTTG
jgi:DNA-binding response OmpR family regulator